MQTYEYMYCIPTLVSFTSGLMTLLQTHARARARRHAHTHIHDPVQTPPINRGLTRCILYLVVT